MSGNLEKKNLITPDGVCFERNVTVDPSPASAKERIAPSAEKIKEWETFNFESVTKQNNFDAICKIIKARAMIQLWYITEAIKSGSPVEPEMELADVPFTDSRMSRRDPEPEIVRVREDLIKINPSLNKCLVARGYRLYFVVPK